MFEQNMEDTGMKSAEELDAEKARREAELEELRAKVKSGTATEEETNKVARAKQLEEQAAIKKSFEN